VRGIGSRPMPFSFAEYQKSNKVPTFETIIAIFKTIITIK
jgi:hypothetical protein